MQPSSALMDSIVKATMIMHNPLAQPAERTEAVNFFEQLKKGEIHSTLYAAAAVTSSQQPVEVLVIAYSLLQHLVKTRWQEMSEQEQTSLVQLGYQNLSEVAGLGNQAWAIKSKAAMLLASCVRYQGATSYEALVPHLLSLASRGPPHAELGCMVLHFVSEDLTQFEEISGEGKRSFLSSLTASVPLVLPWVCKLLEQHFQAAVQANNSHNADGAQSHAAVVSAALGTLSSLADWAPMTLLLQYNLVDTCSFFINTPQFRGPALEILRQISQRKKTTEAQDVYEALMGRLAGALIAVAGPLLQPSMQGELDFEGTLEEFGKRLCSTMVLFGDNHFACMTPVDQKYLYLQLMLGFTRHPYLELSYPTLPFWNQILRDSLPTTTTPSPAKLPTSASGSPGPPPAPAFVVPVDCCQALVGTLATQLLQVVLHNEESGTVPPYMDSHQEYKELCGNYRGSVKLVVRLATAVAPEQCLSSASLFLQKALEVCLAPTELAKAKQIHLEAAVFMLESVLPPLCEPPACQCPNIVAGMTTLLQRLLAVRLADPLLMIMHARGLESFAKYLALCPDMLPPLVSTSFQLMQLMPLEQNGQLPPPPKVTPEWKEAAQGRMNMSKVLLTISKAVPQVVAPHLEALASQVQSMWSQGLIRQGERVHMFDGLLAASSVTPPAVQSQVLEWILRPVHKQWTDPTWLSHLQSPEVFIREYISFSVDPKSGGVSAGSREQRWSLYHAIALFERAARQVFSSPPSSDAAAAIASTTAISTDHPLAPHMEWILKPIGRIVHCLHALWSPSLRAGPLAPVAPALEMDPVERALRMGEDRKTAKKNEEDPGTLAGTNLAALRYWLRAVREESYMLMALVATNSSSFWTNMTLSDELPRAVMSYISCMDQRHMRVLLRHVIVPWVVACPVNQRGRWLLPMFRELIPLLHRTLSNAWSNIGEVVEGMRKVSAEKSEQLQEEVVQETLIRESSREYLTLLGKMTETPGGPSSSTSSPPPPSIGPASPTSQSSHRAGQTPLGPNSGPPVESLLEYLWRTDNQAGYAAAASAVASLNWPDSETARRGTTVCRFIAQLAEQSHPELEATVLPDMLRSAILGSTRVSNITIQADVVGVIRHILITWLPRGSEAIRDVLRALPHVDMQVLKEFERLLMATGSEKEQRNLIKQLLAEAGGEQVRSVFNAVSRVPVLNVVEARARQPPPDEDPEWDKALSSALWHDGQ